MREVTIRSLSNELAENRKMLAAQMDAAKVREAALAESRGEVERLVKALEQIANYESDADTHLTFRRIANRALSKVALEALHEIELLERYREALERIMDVSPWGSDQYAMAREALEAE